MLGGYFGVGIKQVPKSWCAGQSRLLLCCPCANLAVLCFRAMEPLQLAPGELCGEGSSLWLLFGWHGNAENNNNSSFLAPR